MNKFFGHLKTVIKHKRWVGHYCFMCGLYWQGITHDLSKFSITEFGESVKYYTGTRSPIDVCKEQTGYSEAWQHHKGRNKHHYEYWTDNYDKGTTNIKMPWKYALEMVCDYLGAGRAYKGKDFSMKYEYDWWQTKREIAFLHKDTKWIIDILFDKMKRNGIEKVLKDKALLKSLKETYELY